MEKPDQTTMVDELVSTLVQEPPVEVDPEIEHRLKRIIPISQAGGVVIGLVCGYVATVVATTILPTRPVTWPTSQLIELFLAVAAPVCLAEYFLSPRILRRMAKASRLRVRSLRVSDGRLRLELAVGKPFDVRLDHLRISPAAVSDGWYRISMPGGRTSLRFYVPTEIASKLMPLIPNRS